MFGHDNQNDENQTNNAPVVSPTDDGAQTAPPFDTSSISLPGSAPVADEPVAATPAPAFDEVPAPAPVAPITPDEPADDDHLLAATTDHDDLLTLKQSALQELSPLVGHLDQTPEEKFRTTMMMIQASDDQSLIKEAYDAAKAMTDEKARAQALLDIINEINYFTQQSHQE